MSEETKKSVEPIANPFGDGFEESKAGEFVKWEKPGQAVKGILIDVTERRSTVTGEMQKIYSFEGEDGNLFRVGSRGQSFDSAMKSVVFGQWVGFYFASEVPAKKKGFSPFKLIKVYPGQIDKEWLEKSGTSKPKEEEVDINEIIKG